jgi:hypothetical protein
MFIRMVSEPLAPPSEVEWMWMAVPSMGTLEVPTLAFGPPLAAALAPAAALTLVVIPTSTTHVVEVGGGS